MEKIRPLVLAFSAALLGFSALSAEPGEVYYKCRFAHQNGPTVLAEAFSEIRAKPGECVGTPRLTLDGLDGDAVVDNPAPGQVVEGRLALQIWKGGSLLASANSSALAPSASVLTDAPPPDTNYYELECTKQP